MSVPSGSSGDRPERGHWPRMSDRVRATAATGSPPRAVRLTALLGGLCAVPALAMAVSSAPLARSADAALLLRGIAVLLVAGGLAMAVLFPISAVHMLRYGTQRLAGRMALALGIAALVATVINLLPGSNLAVLPGLLATAAIAFGFVAALRRGPVSTWLAGRRYVYRAGSGGGTTG